MILIDTFSYIMTHFENHFKFVMSVLLYRYCIPFVEIAYNKRIDHFVTDALAILSSLNYYVTNQCIAVVVKQCYKPERYLKYIYLIYVKPKMWQSNEMLLT